MRCWLQSSLERVFPNSPVGTSKSHELLAARNERVSFQACLHNPTAKQARVRLSISGPEGMSILVRRVGYVPMSHHTCDTEPAELDGVGHIPGYVPDPLFPEDTASMGPYENQPFWITVTVPEDAKPGTHELTARFVAEDEIIAELTTRLQIRPLTIKPRQGFPVTHWHYPDSFCDWYKLKPFEERFWALAEPYIADLISHGSDCLYVPIFNMPIESAIRPAQLLKIDALPQERYRFDFSDVKRWTALGRKHGAKYFEWTHLFSQWGAKHPVRVYRNNDTEDSILWPPDTAANSDTYRNFLTQFLPAFHKFLLAENLLDCSFFHMSDEPQPGNAEHYENYKYARATLSELAPWMNILDALSETGYAREGLCQFPCPGIGAAARFIEAEIPHWVYYCCEHRGRLPSRYLDTPLAKIRMQGWLFYRLRAAGFLQWGYNYWYRFLTQEIVDPFVDQACGRWPNIPHGDGFLVYPGEAGPIDSIRWEIFAESLQDYALMQSAGISPEDALLDAIKSYDDYPHTEEWICATRQEILTT